MLVSALAHDKKQPDMQQARDRCCATAVDVLCVITEVAQYGLRLVAPVQSSIRFMQVFGGLPQAYLPESARWCSAVSSQL